MFGISELLVLVSVIVVVFGWRKIPQIGGSLGKSILTFKKALKGQEDQKPIKDVKQLKD